MRKAIALALALAILVAAALWFLTAPARLSSEMVAHVSEAGDPTQGHVVFLAAGCESCHQSQGQEDPTRLGGGLALKTPFGTFYPPNISPDTADGIGAWSAADLASALWLGVSPQATHYYPAFPYGSFHWMKVKDVRDLFAYLRTLPPVTGKAPATSLAFPFDIRRAVGLWKRLYLPSASPAETERETATWSLGRYLVEGPGHCAECHSPRDALGGIVAARRLMGGPLPDGKGKAPDLTAAGLKDWSKGDIAEALKSGFTPSGDTLGGAMAAVVRNTGQLPDAYREAIAEYLKSK